MFDNDYNGYDEYNEYDEYNKYDEHEENEYEEDEYYEEERKENLFSCIRTESCPYNCKDCDYEGDCDMCDYNGSDYCKDCIRYYEEDQ